MATTPQNHNHDTPEEIIFDANLQEFATQIGIVCSLESGGKIEQHEAYTRIKKLWKELRASKRNLQIEPHNADQPKDDEATQ